MTTPDTMPLLRDPQDHNTHYYSQKLKYQKNFNTCMILFCLSYFVLSTVFVACVVHQLKAFNKHFKTTSNTAFYKMDELNENLELLNDNIQPLHDLLQMDDVMNQILTDLCNNTYVQELLPTICSEYGYIYKNHNHSTIKDQLVVYDPTYDEIQQVLKKHIQAISTPKKLPTFKQPNNFWDVIHM